MNNEIDCQFKKIVRIQEYMNIKTKLIGIMYFRLLD